MQRRTFMTRLLAAAAAGASATTLLNMVACSCRSAAPACADIVRGVGAERTLTADARRSLEAAQDRLLPSALGSPGARDVGATAYLERGLRHPDVDADSCAVIARGLARLDVLADDLDGRPFAALPAARRDEALQRFEDEDGGQPWLAVMLAFTLEALLGDPAHGGNPGEVGWTWLGHRPGFPRPAGPS